MLVCAKSRRHYISPLLAENIRLPLDLRHAKNMSKLEQTKASFADVKEIDGVSGHPDRYIDDDEDFRARVWFTFDEIARGAETISFIKFTRSVHLKLNIVSKMLLNTLVVTAFSWWRKKNKQNKASVKLTDEMLNVAQKKFTEFDTNHRSALDRDELAGLLRSLHLESLVTKEAEIENANRAVPKPSQGKKEAKKPAPLSNAQASKTTVTPLPPAEELLSGDFSTEDPKSMIGMLTKIPYGHQHMYVF